MTRPLVILLALLAVAGTAVVGWLVWSSRIAADVEVAWSPESPACDGTSVLNRGSQRPVIEATETMRCVVSVRVTNHSRRAVRLGDAVAPFVGPETGAVVTAEGGQPPVADVGLDIDAHIPIDRTLGAGRSTSFEIALVFHPQGCNADGTLWHEGWPTVGVEVLGRSFERRGDKDFSFHHEGATPGCPVDR